MHLSVYARPEKPWPFPLGIVLDPEDKVSTTIHSFPAVQIMTVVPGKQGQSFLPNNLDKITQLRKNGYTGQILIDGSVNAETLKLILQQKYRPDVLNVGSYLVKANNPHEHFQILEKMIQEHKKMRKI